MVTITGYGSQRILPDDRCSKGRGGLKNDYDYRSRKWTDPERRTGSDTERMAAVGTDGRRTQAENARRPHGSRFADSVEVTSG